MIRKASILFFLSISAIVLGQRDCSNPYLDEVRDSMLYYNSAFSSEKSLILYEKVKRNEELIELDQCETMLWIRFEEAMAYQLLRLYDKGLNSFFDLIISSRAQGYSEIEAESHLSIALIYEFIGDMDNCGYHLKAAQKVIERDQVEESFPRFCIRSASYNRFIGKKDQAKKFAQDAIESATAIGDTMNILDGHMLLGILEEDITKAIANFDQARNYFVMRDGYVGAASQSLNIARTLIRNGRAEEANSRIDKAFDYLGMSVERNKDYYTILSFCYMLKKDMYKAQGNLDSALYYMEKYNEILPQSIVQTNKRAIADVEAKYTIKLESQKTEQLLKESKFQRIGLIVGGILLAIFALMSLLLYRNRNRIKRQNQLILEQVDDLKSEKSKSDLLLSEIHHRVKNNLQNILGLILLKKNSLKEKNERAVLEDIQNKILGLSFIYEDLDESGNIEKVNTSRYLDNLVSSILREHNKQNVRYDLQIEKEVLNIETIIPIGMISSELLGNSLNKNKNTIEKLTITLNKQEDGLLAYTYNDYKESEVDEAISYYMDDIGQKIVKSMCRQLRGECSIEGASTFVMYFKEKSVSKV